MRDGLKIYDSDTHSSPMAETLESYFDAAMRNRLPEWESCKVPFRVGWAGEILQPPYRHRYQFKKRAGWREELRVLGEAGSREHIAPRFTDDFCGNHPHHLKSLIVVSSRAIEASVQESKHARAPWVAGIHPNLAEGVPIDHPDLEPIWAAANDAGLRVAHHSFTSAYPGYRDLWGQPIHRPDRIASVGRDESGERIFGAGIMDRYPNIRYCILESGFGGCRSAAASHPLA